MKLFRRASVLLASIVLAGLLVGVVADNGGNDSSEARGRAPRPASTKR